MRSRKRVTVISRRRAVVLLLVLIIVVALTLSAYRYSDAMSGEYQFADSSARAMQAQALADSGINYAAALLSDPGTFSGVLNSAPWNNAQVFHSVIVQPHDHPRFRGRFSVIAPPGPDESLGSPPYRYGVSDEAAKINLNTMMLMDPSGKSLHDRLMALPNMTEDVADAIVDWLDTNNRPRPNGAEDDYYLALNRPYHCKNGPLDSLEELLLVRGVTPELLFGNDRNRNGVLDPGEDDGSGRCDRGWSAYLTIYSREQDFDSQYNPRVYVNSSDVKTVYEKLLGAVGKDLAYYIAAYRLYGPAANPAQQRLQQVALTKLGTANGETVALSADSGDAKQSAPAAPKPALKAKTDQAAGETKAPKKSGSTTPATSEPTQPKVADKGERDDLDFSQKPAKSITSLYELIGTSVTIPNKQKGTTHYACPLNDADTLTALLPLLLDKATTRKDPEIPARININTASLVVLMTLPGLTQDELDSILEHRPNPLTTQPPAIFQTPAWLITEANFPPTRLMQLEKYITTRSQSYRMQVLGYFDRGGPIARAEAVIDTNNGRPRIVYRRDLTELMPGFNLER